MTDETRTTATELTRREAVKRGAVVGGTLLWATPVVQTLTMSSAHAATSPTTFTGPSYVAMNVTCNGKNYYIKFEGDLNDFEDDPWTTPDCPFTQIGTKIYGGAIGFSGTASGNCIQIIVPAGCTVTAAAVKKGRQCAMGATGTGTLLYCS
jgi:hypothetical protein